MIVQQPVYGKVLMPKETETEYVPPNRYHEALEYGNWAIKALGDSYKVQMTENAIHKQLEASRWHAQGTPERDR